MNLRRLAALERALLLANALGTGAATVVLALWPAAIPAVIGVDLRPEQFIVCYFLAGSEAAICFMCILTLRSQLQDVRIMAFQVLIVLHASTAVLSIVGMIRGSSVVILWNVGLRVGIVLLLALAVISRLSFGSEHSDR